ncbi:hypothetical protein ANN_12496 [Periplaneta americana]|uniref:Reverse transcriptase domain-containing protein n=1 Tax=Periplaneta americana TaxID=6978 RepID=A0ABQ8TGP4_PERAM|nr:hypothetical protein ANN_12496 [Periplaneta americana]
MSSNISAVRAIPGRTLSTTRCRHPDCSELETLGHVLGQCPKGELLINARHHRVRHALAISLKTLNWEIHEEVHCVSSDGSFRRADIIAINGRLKRALVLDPTIRFERNLNQATEVDIEKKSIYEPCLPYLSQKYNVPLKQWSVIGLLFGSRGSITKFTWHYLKELHIPFDYVMSILINIIKLLEFWFLVRLNHVAKAVQTHDPLEAPHRKKSHAVISGDLGGHVMKHLSLTPARPIQRSDISVFSEASIWGGGEIEGKRRIKCIRFADDMALLAEEEMILRDMLLELNDSCEQYGMKINANKTKTMVVGRKIKKG